jgi:hypothetical protein
MAQETQIDPRLKRAYDAAMQRHSIAPQVAEAALIEIRGEVLTFIEAANLAVEAPGDVYRVHGSEWIFTVAANRLKKAIRYLPPRDLKPNDGPPSDPSSSCVTVPPTLAGPRKH